jgi:hypothetical protein
VAFSHTRHLILYTLDPTPLLTLGIAKSTVYTPEKERERREEKKKEEMKKLKLMGG